MPYPYWQALTRTIFSIIRNIMLKKQLLAGLLALILAACNLTPAPASQNPTVPNQPTTPVSTEIQPNSSPTETPSPTPTPEVRIRNADQEFFNGDYVQAQSEYQIALSGSSDAAIQIAALWGLGRVEYQVGNNAKALEDLWNLANTHPESIYAVRAYYLIGEIYMRLERYAEAGRAFTVYLALRPNVIDYYAQELRGDAYYAAKNYGDAIAAYKAALAAPHIGDTTGIEIKIAQAYAGSGDNTTALTMYDSINSATTNDYVHAQMDLLMGQVYLASGNTEEAYARFLHAVDNYPLSYDSYSALVTLVNAGQVVDDLNRALVDYYAGQYGYALDAFQRYITSNLDTDGTARYYHALTLLKLGSYQDAVDELTSFISNYPGNQNWRSAWGEKSDTQWSELNQYDEAAQTLLDYAKADPDILFAPQSLLQVGRIYERAGRLEDAAQVWESMADEYPGSDLVSEALFQAGIVHVRNGENDKAIIAFQRDMILSTTVEDQARASFWIGKTQQIIGDATSAKSALEQAASLDPTSYYSIRAHEILLNKPVFDPAPALDLNVDLASERTEAEAWLRVTFNLPSDTNLGNPAPLLSDTRVTRGDELWSMGFQDEARAEFEDLRTTLENDAVNSYRLANYVLDLGLYRPAIFALRQVLTLAGEITQSQTLAAPKYFNHVRYGLYYPDIILPAAEENGFDSLFLYAVVRQESLFEGFVHSTAGARGLLQIVPATGQEISGNLGWPPNFTPEDLYRPIVSIILGTNYLMNNRVRLNGDLYATLAAYNAGATSEEIWRSLSGPDPDLFLEVIRFSETSNYIRSIVENYYMYRLLYSVSP
jgi:peptidoglycan lytic transglycosylase